jgi:MATE family multidrug resistance protein
MKMLLEVESLTSFFRINRDLFFRTLALTLAFGFFYSRSAAEGGLLLAVNVILLQYLNWMSYGIDGFAYAAESLVGKYSGARKLDQLRQIVKLSFWWGGGLAIFFSLVYFIFGNQLLSVFTNQAEVIAAAQPYLGWMMLFPIISFACYIWDGIFIGLTASAAMRNAMVISFMLYLGMHYVFSYWWDVHGMWAAFLGFMALRAIFLWNAYRKMDGEEQLLPMEG